MERISSRMMNLLVLLLAVAYQGDCYRTFQGLRKPTDFIDTDREIALDLDFEREILALEQNPSILEASTQQQVVRGYELTGGLEPDLAFAGAEQFLDTETEILNINVEELETFKPEDDLEALYQIKFSQPGVVGYCAPNSEWSPWHNRDRPSGTGDWEVKSLYLPKGTCADKNPSGIQARLVSNKKPYYFGGNVLSISPSTGLVCKNKSQRKGVRCQDYEIRFCCRPENYNNGIVGSCPKDGSWTSWHSRDQPTGTGDWEVRSLYKPKGTCVDDKTPPLAIQARLVSNKKPYQTGRDVVTVNPSVGLVCRKKDQKDNTCNDYEVRYCCKKKDYNNGIVGSCPRDGTWTSWHSRDRPSGTGDWEVRSLYKPKGTCVDDKTPPLAIQARLVSNKQPYQTGGDVVTVSQSLGFICKNNNQQDGRCNDYEVRYCCKKKEDTGVVGYCDTRTSYWTPWHNRDAPGGSGDWEVRGLYRPTGTCVSQRAAPTAIQGRLVSNKKPWTSSGEILSVDPEDGLICQNRLQTDWYCQNYEVRYCCPRKIKPVCPGDLVYNSCGTACPKVCGQRSLPYCTMQCVPGCQCPSGLWKTSDNKCVRSCPFTVKPIDMEELPYLNRFG